VLLFTGGNVFNNPLPPCAEKVKINVPGQLLLLPQKKQILLLGNREGLLTGKGPGSYAINLAK
jgi:hypothetical protein